MVGDRDRDAIPDVVKRSEQKTRNYKGSAKKNTRPVQVPGGIANGVQAALNDMTDTVGDPETFVAKQLGIKKADLPKHFYGDQVDTIALALKAILHDNRSLVEADDTGVGKGRVAAAVMQWAMRSKTPAGETRVPVFITETTSLFTSMYEDSLAIGNDAIQPYVLNNGKDANIVDADGNVIRPVKNHAAVTKDLKRWTGNPKSAMPDGANAIFLSYTQLQRPGVKRDFLRALGDRAVFILDEAHTAHGDWTNKHKAQSAAGFLAEVMQDRPGLYLSATWAKTGEQMARYVNSGLKDLGMDVPALEKALKVGGPPVQAALTEMLARRGLLVRKELRMEGVEFRVKTETGGAKRHRAAQDGAARILRGVSEFASNNEWEPSHDLAESISGEVLDSDDAPIYGFEGGSVINLMKGLQLSMRAEAAADAALASIKRGEAPVIGLEHTMEATLQQYAERKGLSPGDAADLNYADLMQSYLDSAFTYVFTDLHGVPVTVNMLDAKDKLPKAQQRFAAQAEKVIGQLREMNISASPVDTIRARLSEYKGEELSGRKLRLVDGKLEAMEKPARAALVKGFNRGDYDYLIITSSGATGINLHASNEYANQKRRNMVVAEIAGNINVFKQMTGRVNRTGQVVAPSYEFIKLDLPSESRPMMVAMRKMRSLGASTTADLDVDLETGDPDVLNPVGDQAVATLLAENADYRTYARLPPPKFDELTGRFSGVDAEQVLGRMALAPVKVQEAFRADLQATYELMAQQSGEVGDGMGIPQLNLRAEAVSARTYIKGTGEGLAGDVQMVEANVDAQGEPPTAARVMAAIRKNLGGKTADEYAQAEIKRLQEDVGYIDNLKDDAGSDSQTAGKSQRAVEEYEDQEYEVAEQLKFHKVGTRMHITLNGKRTAAVIIDSRSSHKSGSDVNPMRASALRITLAVAGGKGQVTFTPNQLDDNAKADFTSGPTVQEGYSESIPEAHRGKSYKVEHQGLELWGFVRRVTGDTATLWTIAGTVKKPLSELKDGKDGDQWLLRHFPAKAKRARERRWIAVGNPLKMAEVLGRRGRMVRFTDAGGREHLGMLMKPTFTVSGGVNGEVPLTNVEDFIAVMDGRVTASTPDGAVTVSPVIGASEEARRTYDFMVKKRSPYASSITRAAEAHKVKPTNSTGSMLTYRMTLRDLATDGPRRKFAEEMLPLWVSPETAGALPERTETPSFDGERDAPRAAAAADLDLRSVDWPSGVTQTDDLSVEITNGSYAAYAEGMGAAFRSGQWTFGTVDELQAFAVGVGSAEAGVDPPPQPDLKPVAKKDKPPPPPASDAQVAFSAPLTLQGKGQAYRVGDAYVVPLGTAKAALKPTKENAAKVAGMLRAAGLVKNDDAALLAEASETPWQAVKDHLPKTDAEAAALTGAGLPGVVNENGDTLWWGNTKRVGVVRPPLESHLKLSDLGTRKVFGHANGLPESMDPKGDMGVAIEDGKMHVAVNRYSNLDEMDADLRSLRETKKVRLTAVRRRVAHLPSGRPLSADYVRDVVASMKLPGDVTVQVVDKPDPREFPGYEDAGEILGWIDRGEGDRRAVVSINAGAMRSKRDVQRTVAHEIFGHHGFDKLIGRLPKEQRDRLEQWFKDWLMDPRNRKSVAEFESRYGHAGLQGWDKFHEYVAMAAEKRTRGASWQSILDKGLDILRAVLKAMGIQRLSQTEMRDIVRASRDAAWKSRAGTGQNPVIRFSLQRNDSLADHILDSAKGAGRRAVDNPFTARGRGRMSKHWGRVKKRFFTVEGLAAGVPTNITRGRIIHRDGKTSYETYERRGKEGELFQERLRYERNRSVGDNNIVRFSEQYKKSVASAYKKSHLKLDMATKAKHNRQLQTYDHIPGIPAEVRDTLLKMRSVIDQYSKKYVDVLRHEYSIQKVRGMEEASKRTAKLAAIITGNLGGYAHRSYRIHDDPEGWRKHLEKNPQLIDAAVKSIEDAIYQDGQNTKRADLFKGAAVTREEARNEAVGIVRQMLDASQEEGVIESWAAGKLLGGRSVGILMKRKNLSAPVRAVLGERVDAMTNYANSIHKLSSLVASHSFQLEVYEALHGLALWDDGKQPIGTPTRRIGMDKRGSPIGTGTSSRYSTLYGLHATEDVYDFLHDAVNEPLDFRNPVVKRAVQANGYIKIGLTVYSPKTSIRNFISGFSLIVQNGDYSAEGVRRAWQSKGFAVLGSSKKDADAKAAYWEDLVQRGVVLDTVHGKELSQLFADADVRLLFEDPEANMPQIRAFLRKSHSVAQKIYSYGDDAWKVIGYEAKWRKFHEEWGWSVEDAKREAANRVRETYSTYSMLPRAAQALRRNPFVSPFGSFQAVVLLSMKNQIKYIVQDYKSGDKNRRADAIRRIVSSSTGFVMMEALHLGSMAFAIGLLGELWDLDDAMRDLGPWWRERALMIFLADPDEEGKLRFIDLQHWDFYGLYRGMLHNALRLGFGDNLDIGEMALQTAKSIFEPFYGPDMLAGLSIDVMTNENSWGMPIWHEGAGAENWDVVLEDITAHAAYKLAPGGVKSGWGVGQALAGGHRRSGRAYDLLEESSAFFGVSASHFDPSRAMRDPAFRYLSSMEFARQYLRGAILHKDSDDGDIEDAYERGLRTARASLAKLQQAANSGMELGVTKASVANTLKLSGVPRRTIGLVLEGMPLPYWQSVSKASAGAMYRTAVSAGMEKAEVKRRIEYALELSERSLLE